MKCDLINAIKLNTETIFTNADIMLKTCDMDYVLCDMPIWKHCYHMLHSLDQWYINPNDDMPPLIVHFVNHGFELCDGNHRFEALTQLGAKEYPVIVWITEKNEYEEFVERYGIYLKK